MGEASVPGGGRELSFQEEGTGSHTKDVRRRNGRGQCIRGKVRETVGPRPQTRPEILTQGDEAGAPNCANIWSRANVDSPDEDRLKGNVSKRKLV